MKPPEAGDQIATRRIYTGRVVSLDLDTVRYPNGERGELEMIRHPGAAAVVPMVTAPDAADPAILLIRQYRYAAGGPVWEVPAGRLEPGESPEACARRELAEEAGRSAERVEYLTTIFTTPGFTDERIHLFVAYGLGTHEHRREADELIEVHTVSVREVLRMIRDGEMSDAKSIAAVLYLAGFRLGMYQGEDGGGIGARAGPRNGAGHPHG